MLKKKHLSNKKSLLFHHSFHEIQNPLFIHLIDAITKLFEWDFITQDALFHLCESKKNYYLFIVSNLV